MLKKKIYIYKKKIIIKNKKIKKKATIARSGINELHSTQRDTCMWEKKTYQNTEIF